MGNPREVQAPQGSRSSPTCGPLRSVCDSGHHITLMDDSRQVSTCDRGHLRDCASYPVAALGPAIRFWFRPNQSRPGGAISCAFASLNSHIQFSRGEISSDEKSFAADLRKLFCPVTIPVICHHTRIHVPRSLKDHRICGCALWDHHHVLLRQTKPTRERSIMLVLSREQVSRVGIKDDARGKTVICQPVDDRLDRFKSGLSAVPVHDIRAVDDDRFRVPKLTLLGAASQKRSQKQPS